ncbi:hypothetical protein VTJ04DRAFT_7988 [Mycothermus thermophilus]|uniref:uncharacterized protein n=1 Tax=Humicola insolens TaxID=85995 RepID=UPI003742A4F9
MAGVGVGRVFACLHPFTVSRLPASRVTSFEIYVFPFSISFFFRQRDDSSFRNMKTPSSQHHRPAFLCLCCLSS